MFNTTLLTQLSKLSMNHPEKTEDHTHDDECLVTCEYCGDSVCIDSEAVSVTDALSRHWLCKPCLAKTSFPLKESS